MKQCKHFEVDSENSDTDCFVDPYEPNGTAQEVKLGILHNVNGYCVSNEGTRKKPNYHVWIPGLTHSVCDSAYSEMSLAVCRCNYLARNKIKARYQAS